MRGLLKFLVMVAIILGPVLFSPVLRATLVESLPETADQLFPENFWRDFGIVSAAAIGSMLLLYLCIWLWNEARSDPRSSLTGWKRVVFVASSLVMFMPVSGFWVWGVIDFSRHAEEYASDPMFALVLFFLAVVGMIALSLARPAYWAVRLLIKR